MNKLESEILGSIKDEDFDLQKLVKTPYNNTFIFDCNYLIKYDGDSVHLLNPMYFSSIDNFSLGKFAFVTDETNKRNILDCNGNLLFETWCRKIEVIGNSLFIINSSINNFSLYNCNGDLLFDSLICIPNFNEGFAIITKMDSNIMSLPVYNYIDQNGSLLLKKWVLIANDFVDGYAIVKTGAGYGLINTNGEFLLEDVFEKIIISPFYFHIEQSEKRIYYANGKVGCKILTVNKIKKERRIYEYVDSYLPELNIEEFSTLGYDSCLIRKNHQWFIRTWSYGKTSDVIVNIDGIPDNKEPLSSRGYCIVLQNGFYNIIYTDGRLLETAFEHIKAINQDYIQVRDSNNHKFNILNIHTNELMFGAWLDKEPFYVTIKDAVVISEMPLTISQNKYTNTFIDVPGSFLTSVVVGHFHVLVSTGRLSDQYFNSIEYWDSSRSIFTDCLLKVSNGEKYNLVNSDGRFVLNDWYSDIVIERENSYYSIQFSNAIKVKNELYDINYHDTKSLLFPVWFDTLKIDHPGYIELSTSFKFGLFTFQYGLFGNRMFDKPIVKISDTLFCGYEEGTKKSIGYIFDYKGSIISSDYFNLVGDFQDGYATLFYDGYTINFIDKNGNIILEQSIHTYIDLSIENDFYIVQKYDPKDEYVKEYQENVLDIKNKKFLFKKWYDSIEGCSGRWIVCDNSLGESCWTVVDNDGISLTGEFYKRIFNLQYLRKDCYVVEKEDGNNIINEHNLYTLPHMYREEIFDYPETETAAVGYNYTTTCPQDCPVFLIDHNGYLISELPYEHYVRNIQNPKQPSDYLKVFYFAKKYYSDCNCTSECRLCNQHGISFLPQDLHFYNVDIVSLHNGLEYFDLTVKPLNHQKYSICSHVITSLCGEIMSYEQYDKILEPNTYDYIPVIKEQKFNLLNQEFNTLFPIWFDEIGYTYKSKKYEYEPIIDEYGYEDSRRYVVEEIKRNCDFINGYLKVKLLGKYNYVNEESEYLSNIWFDKIFKVSENIFYVCLNGKYNFLDKNLEQIAAEWYDRIRICKKNDSLTVFYCKFGNKIKFAFMSNEKIVFSKDWFDKISNYENWEGYYPVYRDSKKNLISEGGETLLPLWYDDIYVDLDVSYVVVQKDNKKNIFSIDERKLISNNYYDDILLFENDSLIWNGYFCIMQDGKYNLMRIDGTLVSHMFFDKIHRFTYGFAGVELGNKKNYISEQGIILSERWFDKIGTFSEYGKARVILDNEFNIIDKNGNLIFKNKFQKINSIKLMTDKYCKVLILGENQKEEENYFSFKSNKLYNSLDALQKNEKINK